jgi:hypothetical protein
MAKQQTGLRLERVLFKQFQELCHREKLRPGEAVESLIRSAVDLGSIVAVSLSINKPNNPGQSMNRMLFRSRLSRMKSVLGQQRRYSETIGTTRPYGVNSKLYALEDELAELGRKGIDEELLREFETLLAELDKLHADVEKGYTEDRISDNRGDDDSET